MIAISVKVCKISLLLLLIVFISGIHSEEIFRKNREANRLYEQGMYEEALNLYEDALLLEPENEKLRMNRGSTLYRLNQFDLAEESYKEALSNRDPNTLVDAHYNLGNIQFRQGQQLQSAGDPSAMEKYSAALENYVQSLKIRPDDKDAKWNLQLTHQMIEELEQQQSSQQQGDESENDEDGDESKSSQQQDASDDEGDQQKKQNFDQTTDNDLNEEQDSQLPDQLEEDELRREKAERLIEMYADDADDLHKPKQQSSDIRKPEKDW
ncbi:tetratricopeptide repeat protein [Chitinispirillales bacterium ANBcel5]|uniref:tetratricopeptide repeat protein n=1 Tax=Cellulosispirillum alkaliphilum TaxID=3039283 RepID=UPI002A5165FF|nr:tetratricopeptide repeat protein [Chitinispirillales bacterium ANBcel5]